MNRKMSALVPLLVFAMGAAACDRSLTAPIVSVPAEVLAASSQITIGATTLRLASYLWRDFQPPVENEPPLLAQLRIQADGGNPIPSGLRVDQAWVVLDDQAWLVIPRQEVAAPNVATLEVMARGGPPWPVGSSVIVIVQVREASNVPHLLRAAPQIVARTD